MRHGISLANRSIIQEFKKECLNTMGTNGLSSSEPLVATGNIYNFLGNNRESNPVGWYMACEGVSRDGIPYFRCLYGSLTTNEKYEYKSWDEGVVLSKHDMKELNTLLEKMSTYLDMHFTDFVNDFRDRFLIDKKTAKSVIGLSSDLNPKQENLLPVENIVKDNISTVIIDDDQEKSLINPEILQPWEEFLNQINSSLLKSIFSNAEFLGIRDNFVSIRLFNNSKFFQGKIPELKNIWNPMFQKIFPSMELKIMDAR